MIEELALTKSILEIYRADLGKDYDAYSNHINRVYTFFRKIYTDPYDPVLLQVALAFHDIGIWTHKTLDYLQPSNDLAQAFVQKNHIKVNVDLLAEIILNHHQVSKNSHPLVEAYKKADNVDLSLGVASFGLEYSFIKETYQSFPAKGFHWLLTKLFFQQLASNPLNPLPMFKR